MKEKITIEDKEFEVYIRQQQIREKVEELTPKIDDAFRDAQKLPVAIPILNGALNFAMDFFSGSELEYQWFPVKISSYTGMERGKEIEILSSDLSFLRGRDVLILEDIVDSGHTMATFIKELEAVLPRSIRLATLLIKPKALEKEIRPDWVGFEITNEFVVGYGMDYNEKGRALQQIYHHKGNS